MSAHLIATSTPLTIAVPAVFAAWRRHVPMVLEVRDLWPEVPIALGALRSPLSRRSALALEAWAYRKSTEVIALSVGMAEGVRARRPDARVTVIPNGCDIELFADAAAAGKLLRDRTPWLGDQPLILYAGTVGFVNDVGYLIQMARTLRHTHPDIRIAIIGQGAEVPRLRTEAAACGVLDGNLFMLDPMPKNDIVSYFGACDLAVSTVRDEPALHANSANKVFDALAAGRPVAINHEGWLADMLRHSGAGLVLPAGDPAGAAALVASFVSDPIRRASAGAAARALAISEFDREMLFQRFEEVLLRAALPEGRIDPPRQRPGDLDATVGGPRHQPRRGAGAATSSDDAETEAPRHAGPH
ncbi:glycosyltransferase family 4 protein [Micromonospora humi]|uniref:Glycosyltransferase involved in cell wall bisynthesis n=1 Tax=Micromonospora humi TaxID=745366 RepID=A0A1C5K7H1_9ACTN|nr:glycosyltransferase family 4 protein [Micromonospora humi]SCG78654.1 Glycosyltransferase involved in cell wall bisynthesis [Micromonospora humi]